MPETSQHSSLCLCGFCFFFGLLNTKGIKLGISPTDTKFKHIYMDTSHIYIEINDTYYLEPGTGLPNDQR